MAKYDQPLGESGIEWTNTTRPCYSIAVAQTMHGAKRIAARRIGISVEEYDQRREAGQAWCTGCKSWHLHAEFGIDHTRRGGIATTCRTGRARRHRATYESVAREHGKALIPARDGDRKQARRRVNFFVESGLLPPPNTLPCIDCGHIYRPGERRHEYDHHLGYAAEHHEAVQVVCSRCHHQRENIRLSEVQ